MEMRVKIEHGPTDTVQSTVKALEIECEISEASTSVTMLINNVHSGLFCEDVETL
jgi:hypothetical protein